MNIECPHCDYEGKAKYGRSQLIEIVLLLTTFWLAWLPLWFYYGFTKRWICPKCDFKNVIKQ